ncbi:hypothetical protein JYT17_00515, partial [Nitrospira defluvii]|nr:hypothetical protein [Nitrospira defluvii]
TRISYLIEKHPQIASNSEILEMLIWYALKGKADENQISDAQHTDRETITIETLLQKSGTIYMRGINGERGQAWETLGTILWKVPEAEPRVWETIDIALEKESRISVRCCIMKPLLPLFNMNKERFSESIRKLIILPEGVAQQSDASRLSPLITSAGIQLFPYIFNWLPELGSELAQLLLESGDETTELMGAWLIFCASFSHGTHIQKADELEALSVNHRRLLADVASQAINWAENRNRAEKLLKRFFFDEDEQIRQKAADAFRHIKADEVEKYRELTVIFLKSPAFMENSASVMHMLKSATGDVLELIVEAAQQLIRNIVDRGDECGSHAADAHYLQDLLKREYTASESKPEARKIILDLIDLMLKNEIYGVEGIVAAHERW